MIQQFTKPRLFFVGYIFPLLDVFAPDTDKYLTLRGPCIVIYSYNESQRDALFLKFI